MTWQEVRHHDRQREWFARSVAKNRLASAFLFVGPGGIGKRTFATALAQSLLCEANADGELQACGSCPSCQQVLAGSHPDLDVVERPKDKSTIPLELLIGDDEHRGREGLCHRISLKPYGGRRKVAILDDADYLNQEGANALLKTLEEPPPRSVIVLIGTSEQKQLPTIRSRSQIIRFQALPAAIVAELLFEKGLASSVEEAAELSQVCDGSIAAAMEYRDPEVREFRDQWLAYLAAASFEPGSFTKELSGFIDSAGKEAPLRRARFRFVAQMSAGFFQRLHRRQMESSMPPNVAVDRAVEVALKNWPRDTDLTLAAWERCLTAEAQIDANANQATLVEAFLDDLGRIAQGVLI